MAEKIRYGVVGTSRLAVKFVEALGENKNSEVVANFGYDFEKAKQFAKTYGVANTYEKLADLFIDSTIDIVYLAIKNEDHYESAKLALEAGKNVLLEKPFTRHKVGARELFLLAQKKNLFIMESQSALFLPILEKIKELISDGVIGKINFINIQENYDTTDKKEWFTKLSAGGGAFINGGTTPIGLIQYLTGKAVTEWNGFEFNEVGKADTRCNLTLKVDDVLANITIATDFNLETKIVIYGTKGEVEIPNYWESSIAYLKKNGEERKIIANNSKNELMCEINHINTSLTNNEVKSSIVTPDLTMHTMTIIESMYQKWYGDPLN
ncbi:Gfo/Idh/MocA family protein [Liquorilactobacillus cacaonum]|uniref:Gfo Idh MocA family oxidoreductase n=1 Tax=Liquorilactobacillus cacaonum DSM 21116 TaxID=1423729 RepID=A0A0R2CKB5_9LACO|nr:Gfo/Idh/MocA family oxidoreductase [Liquorilactobacillus cacaonum]KRM91554.1 Gfo Idh MocA family oxidoreductase [Liquorilactobacillus cacaonum DSM 21116]